MFSCAMMYLMGTNHAASGLVLGRGGGTTGRLPVLTTSATTSWARSQISRGDAVEGTTKAVGKYPFQCKPLVRDLSLFACLSAIVAQIGGHSRNPEQPFQYSFSVLARLTACCCTINSPQRYLESKYRVGPGLVVGNLGWVSWVDFVSIIPLSAPFC